MKLREKTIASMAAVWIGIFLVFLVVISSVSLSANAEIEHNMMLDDVGKLLRDLDHSSEILKIEVIEYAHWDDTFEYMSGSRPDYFTDNIFPETFENLHSDLVLFFDDEDRFLSGASYDKTSGTLNNVTDEILNNPEILSAVAAHETTSGLTMVGSTPVMLAFTQILHTGGGDPSGGMMGWGQTLDEEEIASLSCRIGLPLEIIPLTEVNGPALLEFASTDTPATSTLVLPVNNSIVAGYGLLQDLSGDNVAILKTENDRLVYQQGLDTLFRMVLFILLAGIIFGITSVLLIDQLILRRLLFLQNQVEDIGNRGDTALRVDSIGNDELAELSDAVNHLLERLEESQEETSASERKAHSLLNAIPDILISISRDGIITEFICPPNRNYILPESYYLGEPMDKIFPPEIIPEARIVLEKAFTTKEVLKFDYSLLLKGHEVWYDTRFVAVDENYVIALLRDYSSEKLAERSYQEANAKLNLLNSITRHDILNQVAALQLFVSLAMDTCNDDQLSSDLQKIETIGETIQKQIEFTRDYQELGVHGPQWQRMDTMVKEACLQLDIDGWNIEPDFGDLEIFADPLAGKVVYNLIDNSMRHAGPDADMISMSWSPTDHGIEIVYEDNGIGMSQDAKEKLFEKSLRKRHGFGLFLTKEILSITGITIQEEGQPGSGVRFIISIPSGAFRNSGDTSSEK